MKTRMGFVTNSSSSSFILARKQNVDVNRLAKHIYQSGDLGAIIKELEYLDLPPEIETAYQKDDPRLEELLAKYIAEELANYSNDMILDDWLISGGEVSNETSDLLDVFLYNSSNIEFEDIKTTTIW